MSERSLEARRANIRLAHQATTAKAKATRPTLICEHCATPFQVSPSLVSKRGSPRRFCSWDCRQSFMRGANGANSGKGEQLKGDRNPNWKGGIPRDVRTRATHQAEIQQWRRRVFHRDGYTCQSCGLKPNKHGRLRAHHILPWSTHPEHRFDIANGQTLCADCHNAVHRKAS